ncbi:MAG: MFS transporter [Nitrososphaeria archaeon]|nr:MFS transporter [Nitrososphaeria archaeon]
MSNGYDFFKKLEKTFIVFYLFAFCSETAMVLISIYLPYYSYQLGATEIEVGLVGAASGIPYIFIPFIAGNLSDRIGRKKGLMIGTLTVSLCYIIFLLVSNPVLFILIRIIEGVGWSFVWPSMEAILGEDKKKLQIYNIMWGFGATIAPYLGSTIYQIFGAKNILLTSIGLMLPSVLLSKVGKDSLVIDDIKINKLNDFKINSILFFPFIYGIISFTTLTFFPIYAEKTSLSLNISGLALSFMNSGRLIAFIISNNKIFDKKTMQSTFTILLGFLPLGLVFSTNDILFPPLFFSLGFALGITYASALSKILSISESKRGHYAGLFESILGLGAFLGPFIGGIVANASISYTFIIPTIITTSFMILRKIKIIK